MREIWAHGSVSAIMAIYHSPYEKYNDLEHTMLYGGVYKKLSNGATKVPPTFHAVKIVGWGDTSTQYESTYKYWKVANSWGTSYSSASSNRISSHQPAYPEKGFFRILRGENFCGIESSICFASALVTSKERKHYNISGDWMSQFASSVSGSAGVPGGYASIPEPTMHAGVQAALSHYVAKSHHTAGSRRTSDYTLVHVGLQSVHGVNYHLKLTTAHDAERRVTQTQHEAVVHRDMAGLHHITSDFPPRTVLAAEEPGSTATQNTNTQSKQLVFLVVGGIVVVAAALLALMALIVSLRRHCTVSLKEGDGSVSFNEGDEVSHRNRASSVQTIDMCGDPDEVLAVAQGAVKARIAELQKQLKEQIALSQNLKEQDPGKADLLPTMGTAAAAASSVYEDPLPESPAKTGTVII